MARTTSFSQVLWLWTTVWLASCGRLGFDSGDSGIKNQLPDAAVIEDAAPQPVGPKLAVGELPTMTATCGVAPTVYEIALSNPGDQELVISAADVGAAEVRLAPDDVLRGRRAAVAAGTDVFQVITELPISIPAGGTATLEVQPPESVTGTDRAKATKTATLTLTTNAPDSKSIELGLSSTVMGANLDVTPTTLNLTNNVGACPAPGTVQVTNNGNLPAQAVNVAVSSATNVKYDSGFSSGKLSPATAQATKFRPFTTAACQIAGGQITVTGGASTAGVCTDDVTVTVNLNITSSSTGSCFCS